MAGEGKHVAVGIPLLSGMRIETQPLTKQTINGVQFQIVGSEVQMAELMLMPKQM